MEPQIENCELKTLSPESGNFIGNIQFIVVEEYKAIYDRIRETLDDIQIVKIERYFHFF